MTLSLTQTPTYPIKGRTIRVTFTPSASVNYVRVWITDAPIGSAEKRRLDESGATRLVSYEGDTSGTWTFLPDVGGVYVFTAQEYTLTAANFGGDYKDDPDGHKTEAKVGAEQAVTITVGQKLGMPIGAGEDRGQLELWVWGSTIRATSHETHGEKTPVITGTATARSKVAASDSSVVSALAALDGVTASTALGNITTVLIDQITKFTAHTANTWHATADSFNRMADAFLAPADVKSAIQVCQQYIRNLRAHLESNQSQGGVGSGTWHRVGGDDLADLENALLVDPPSDMAGVVSALADAWRAYEAHRVEVAYHSGGADSTNTLTALPALLEVHRAFLSSLRSASPTVPATVNSGVPLLLNSGGMKEL